MSAVRPNHANDRSATNPTHIVPVLASSGRASVVMVGSRAALAVAAISLSLLPWYLAAGVREPAHRTANRQRLNDMTVAERQRLEEAFRQFQALPQSEQERLRELHRNIETDPELHAAFGEYLAWAHSLSPVDRHELRKTLHSDARLQLIDKLRRQPPAAPDLTPGSDRPPNGFGPIGPNFIGRGERPRLLDKLFGRSVPLGGDRLASFVPEMEAIVRVLETELPANVRAELEPLDPFTRQVRVVRLTLERRPSGPPAMRLFGPPMSGTFEKILAALPDGQVKQFAGNRNLNPLEQRNAVLLALIRGLMTEMQRKVEDHRPSPETLRRFAETLSESEQRRLEELRGEERQLELQQQYLKAHVPGIAEMQQLVRQPELERFFQDMIGRMRGGLNPPDGDERRLPRARGPQPSGPDRPRD